jgi:hypothetical protein
MAGVQGGTADKSFLEQILGKYVTNIITYTVSLHR